jgi:hypothetical protein
MKNSSSTNFDGHLRPAQVGDICLLLEPETAEEARLRVYQQALKTRFGGTFIEKVHLTCQRFDDVGPEQMARLLAQLAQVVQETPPFAVTAQGLEPLYVPVRQTHILKWRIEIGAELRQFAVRVDALLAGLGIASHYVNGFIPDLVTALKDVPPVEAAALANDPDLPYHLFEMGRLVVSRIEGPNEFKIEGHLDWPR